MHSLEELILLLVWSSVLRKSRATGDLRRLHAHTTSSFCMLMKWDALTLMWRHPHVCLWIETPKTPVWRHPTLKRKSRQGNSPSGHWGCWIKASTSLVTTGSITLATFPFLHDDVIKWKHFPRYCPFVLGIHRSPVNSPHKGQRRGALIFSLIWASINGWVNNREAGDLRRNRPHYDVTVMCVWNALFLYRDSYSGGLGRCYHDDGGWLRHDVRHVLRVITVDTRVRAGQRILDILWWLPWTL